MKPRKRVFKRDNKLKFAYIKNHSDLGSDFFGTIPTSESRRWDLYLLFNAFCTQPHRPKEWDREKKEWIEYPSLMEELKNRGYDIETVYFEIEKKKENEDDR